MHEPNCFPRDKFISYKQQKFLPEAHNVAKVYVFYTLNSCLLFACWLSSLKDEIHVFAQPRSKDL